MDTLNSIRRDLAHAARSLAKEKTFALVCIASLGIGIGVVVALLTFYRAIVAPARGIDASGLTELLVLPQGELRAREGSWAVERWSYPDFQALRETDTGMAITGWAMETSEVGLPTPDQKTGPLRVETLYVSANYFRTFGVSLARGSGFNPAADDTPSAEPRVILSHGYWQSRAASDPDIVGKSVTIEGIPHVVVGVTPPDFRGHFHFFNSPNTLLFIPLERHPRLRANAGLRHDRTVDWVRIYGRLAEGVNIARANALVSATVAGLAREYPASNKFKAATVVPYQSLGGVRFPQNQRVFSVMMGLGAAVLFIVCLNISGMMLVRGANRERELAIRAALGADRRRLIQQLFFEAVLLAMAAGALSAFVLFGIPAIIGWRMGAPVPQEIDFDAVGAATACGLCLIVSVLFGLMPALRLSRPNLITAMKDEAGGGGRQTIRVHRIAAMVQIGIAVPFLVLSGVMLDRVRTAELGFATDGLAGARVPAKPGPGRDASSIRKVRDNLRQADGVRSVAIADGMPVDFDERLFRVSGAEGKFATAQVTRVGENFLETIGARLLKGRAITAEDRLMNSLVTVLSEPLATQLFPGSEPVGQRVAVTLEDGRDQQFTVVGITADFATSQLTTERPQLLLPLPDQLTPTVHLIVRGAPGDEPKLKAALESALRELGVEALPGVAFPGIVTGQELVEKSFGDLIAESTAVAVAGGVVLVLAALGIVGVVGFMVATRKREIAVRMALGSSRLRVFGLIVSGIVRLVIPGIAGGLLVAAFLIRTMEDVMGTPLTLGPTPLGFMEPLIYAAASTIAVFVALLAGLSAARRATSIQPMVAMRSE